MVTATRPFWPMLSQSRREQILEAHIVQIEAEAGRLRARFTVEAIAQKLDSIHFSGNECGTHGSNACSNCFGPSPMSAVEIARVLAVEESKPEPRVTPRG